MTYADQIKQVRRRRLALSVLLPALALLIFGAAANIALVFRSGEQVYEQGVDQDRKVARAASNRLLTKITHFVADYAYWDEFYDAIGPDGIDPEFASVDLDDYQYNIYTAVDTLAIHEDGSVAYAWSYEDSPERAKGFLKDEELQMLIEDARKMPFDAGRTSVGAFLVHNGLVYAASASVLYPQDEAKRADPNRKKKVYIALSRLDDAAFEEMANDFGMADLTFGIERPDTEAQVELLGPGDTIAGYISWTPRSPWSQLLGGYVWPGIILFTVMGVLFAFMLRNWLKAVDQFQQTAMAADAAEAASRSKSMFIANMSHELRTPLNAIIGFSDIMAGEMFGPHAVPQYREYAADVNQAGKHLLEIVNDVLSVAKLEAGQHTFEIDACHVDETADSAMRSLAEEAEKRGIQIELSPTLQSHDVLADRASLKQTLNNLLSNAVKFSQDGAQISVFARSVKGSEMVEIAVKDNGPGIAPDQLALLGMPFFQIADVMSREHGGTGLGLSIVKGLVSGMGGEFHLDSMQGKGTTAIVRLPRAQSHTLAKAA